jgi:protein TonB
MYKYEQPSLFSGKRGIALIVVILLHIVVGWAFYTGLANRLVATIIPPVEIAQIDKPKDIDKPPPPPPKIEEIKPYVPPPDFVDIQAPVEQTNAIAAVTQTQAPVAAPVAAAPAPPAPRSRHSAAHGSEASAEDRRGVVSRRIEACQ